MAKLLKELLHHVDDTVLLRREWLRGSVQATVSLPQAYRQVHGLINFKDTRTKCRLNWWLIEFIDWWYSQSCWYFRPSFVNCCPSNLLSGSHPPTSSQSQSTSIYRQCVAGTGWGVLSWVGDHILQEINTLYLTRLSKICLHSDSTCVCKQTLYFLCRVIISHSCCKSILFGSEAFHSSVKA